MTRRRTLLAHGSTVATLMLGLGLGLLPRAARAAGAVAEKGAFEAKSMGDVMKALGLAAPVESKDLTLTAPDIAENGAVVPMAAATALPNVRQMMLLIEKNPNTLAAVFNVTPEVEANFSTRAKMGQSSNVYAVAVTNDGKVLYAQKEVKVTLGGCGG